MRKAAVGAVAVFALAQPLVAQCAPTVTPAPKCMSSVRTTFGATWCDQAATRARLTYFSPTYSVYKQSVGPCVAANVGSYAFVPVNETIAGARGISVVWERC